MNERRRTHFKEAVPELIAKGEYPMRMVPFGWASVFCEGWETLDEESPKPVRFSHVTSNPDCCIIHTLTRFKEETHHEILYE